MYRAMLLLSIYLFFGLSVVSAKYNPADRPNNKFGIHIADTNDIHEISKLVNTSGGDWGYVTAVIPDSDKNTGKWQEIFDHMRRYHLIPIVRLATHVEGNGWVKPKSENIGDWITFLNSLNWPIENRYVAIFNEPNHAGEWGGEINPSEYAQILFDFASRLKQSNSDYFILPAGFDASAGNTRTSRDMAQFVREMINTKPEIADLIDGWNSHSYPNPAFSSSPKLTGRGTVRSYIWEMELMQSLGLQKKLPVFITETGWVHSDGKAVNSSLLKPQQVGEYIKIAADSVWSDERIVAVTPFVFSYQDVPFDHFSWKKLNSPDYYDFYDTYRNIPKTKGQPRQRQQYRLESKLFPDELISDSTYILRANITNNGQNILSESDGYKYRITTSLGSDIQISASKLPTLEPAKTGQIKLRVETTKKISRQIINIEIGKDDDYITVENAYINVIKPPQLLISAKLFFKSTHEADNITVLIYDSSEKIIHKITNINLKQGLIYLDRVTNIIPHQRYRIVVLIPRYLPRQIITPLGTTVTSISLERFLPLDLNEDGNFSLEDLNLILMKKPFELWSLMFG